MKSSFPALVLLGVIALTGCSVNGGSTDASAPETAPPSLTGECPGVDVVVDFGELDEPTITQCVETDDVIAASLALETAGVSTEGTAEWGDQIVCRVNDRPAADETLEIDGEAPYTESCASMPAAFAYWALWIKPSASSDWEYAAEGVGTLQSEPGQSLGLVFTTGTETPTPGK